jgi:hypothetical protein
MKLGQNQRPWNPSSGPERYRRGLYTHYWRATPHPALAVFDAPDAFAACTRRLRSNTPLQALTLLNDRQFFEMAQALAQRLLAEGPAQDPDRVDYAFRVCLARPPQVEERQSLLRLLAQQRAESAASVAPAAPVEGGPGDALAPGTPLAAWTAVARVLLNLDETITRE